MRARAAVAWLFVAGCRLGFDPLPDAEPGRCTPGPLVGGFDALPAWATPYSSGAAVLEVTPDGLRIATGTTLADSHAGVHSSSFELVDQQIVIEASEMVNTASTARAYFCLADCLGVLTELMYQEHGMLQVFLAPRGGLIAARPYDPVGDRFWMARIRGGVTSWETSADGNSWLVFTAYATRDATAELWLGAWNNGAADGGSVTFRNFGNCL